MITCPFCGADQVANTIFCNECGHYLLQGEDKGTSALKTGEINYSGYFQVVERPPELPQKPVQQVVLHFKITPQVVIEVRLDKEVLIGRMDPITTVFHYRTLFGRQKLNADVKSHGDRQPLVQEMFQEAQPQLK